MNLSLLPDYDDLPAVSAVLGIFFCALSAPGLIAPSKTASSILRFPRSRIAGYGLSAVALVWAFIWLAVMPFGSVSDFLRPWLQFLLPLSIAAVCIFIPELLACRAIGGLLVLAPASIFSAARWHPSSWRLVIVVLGYVFAIAGMFVISRPWLLRDALTWTVAKPRRFRAVSYGLLSLGIFLLILAAAVFPGAEAPLK